jgi:hypothetical protein
MKIPNIATPDQFFLERSRFKKHPNFSKIKNDYIDAEIIQAESQKAIASKGNAYKNTKSRI